MKTPTIASPARMSESTYNKFTVPFPYVCRKSPLQWADGNGPLNPALETTPDLTQPARAYPQNPRMTQMPSGSASKMGSHDRIEDKHHTDIAKSAAPPTVSAASKGASDSGIFTVS